MSNQPQNQIRPGTVDKNSPSADLVAKFHANSDVDAGNLSQHHTLGSFPGQAAPGPHTHDGGTSKQLMEGVTLTGAKGGNVALANLITALAAALGFTDNTT